MSSDLAPVPVEEVLRALQGAYEKVVPKAHRQLTLEDKLPDLGIGSIAALEMAALLEAQFEIHFPDEKLVRLQTIGGFVELIRELLGVES